MDKKYSHPSVTLDLSKFAAKERMDVWREYNAGMFEVSPILPVESTIDARAQSFGIGNVVLGRYSHSGNMVRRRVLASAIQREDLLVVRMHSRGFTKGAMNDDSILMSPENLTIFDFHQTLNAETRNVDYVSFVVPHSAVGFDPSKHPNFFQIPTQSPVGRVLGSNLKMLLDLAPQASVESATSLIEGFSGLLQGLVTRDLREESVRESFSQSLQVAARRFIDFNIKNPDLDADAICQSVGVSRAVLYRMLKEEGGVRRAILLKRLENAMSDLIHAEPKHGVVARIARDWAFHDQAHFSRLFKETYGCRPSDVVGAALVLNSSPKNVSEAQKTAQNTAVTPLVSLYQSPSSFFKK